MPKSVKELRSLSYDEVVAAHDEEAQHLGATSVNFWLNELARRDQEAQTNTMRKLTWAIAVMTGVMTAATVLNVWLFYH